MYTLNLYEFFGGVFSCCASFSEKRDTISVRFSQAYKLHIFNLIINDFILFVGRFVKFSFYFGEERYQVHQPCDANVNIERLNRQHSRTSRQSRCCNSLWLIFINEHDREKNSPSKCFKTSWNFKGAIIF